MTGFSCGYEFLDKDNYVLLYIFRIQFCYNVSYSLLLGCEEHVCPCLCSIVLAYRFSFYFPVLQAVVFTNISLDKAIASSINENLGDGRLEDLNPKLLRHFAFGSRVVLNPMAAMFGGVYRSRGC